MVTPSSIHLAGRRCRWTGRCARCYWGCRVAALLQRWRGQQNKAPPLHLPTPTITIPQHVFCRMPIGPRHLVNVVVCLSSLVQDVVYKDVIEPLESVSVSLVPTEKKDVSE